MSKNQKTEPTQNKDVDQLALSKIEAVKNLIFGETIQNYDSEFNQVKQNILSQKKALEQLIDEVQAELKESIDNLSTDINIRISDLENNLEDKIDNLTEASVSKKVLGKLLVELGEKISNK